MAFCGIPRSDSDIVCTSMPSASVHRRMTSNTWLTDTNNTSNYHMMSYDPVHVWTCTEAIQLNMNRSHSAEHEDFHVGHISLPSGKYFSWIHTENLRYAILFWNKTLTRIRFTKTNRRYIPCCVKSAINTIQTWVCCGLRPWSGWFINPVWVPGWGTNPVEPPPPC